MGGGKKMRQNHSPSMHLHVRNTTDGQEWREVDGKREKRQTFPPGYSTAAVVHDGL